MPEPKTITAEFTDNIPDTEDAPEQQEGFSTEDQRDGTRRRLFNMCIVKAENEGLPMKFTCVREYGEEKKKVADLKFIALTVKATFTEIV